MTQMQPIREADFTGLADKYRRYRQGYSNLVLDILIKHTEVKASDSVVVDVGAGTGIWTKQLADRGLQVIAVEPNEEMLQNGIASTSSSNIQWIRATAESTGLCENTAAWVTMASAFHWTDSQKSLAEFARILKPRGYLTLIWNPLVKEGDAIQEQVEAIIKRICPDFTRGSREKDHTELLNASGHFQDVVEVRAITRITMTVDRYVGTWETVNHLQSHAGAARFCAMLEEIKNLLRGKDTIEVPYLTKSWTARKRD